MFRSTAAALLTLTLVSSVALAQDLATRRANRTIRAQEKEVLNRVTQRIEWDKLLTGSMLQVEVLPGGSVLVKGSVPSESAKLRAIDLVENTTGVVTVTDEVAIAHGSRVIEAKPAPASRSTEVIESVPSESRVISKP